MGKIRKIIFLDMDGTLLNKEKNITEMTRNILYQLVQKEIEIILISGRSNVSMEYIANTRINTKYPIIRYLISTDGTMIKDIKENKIIYQNSLNLKTVFDLIKESQKIETAFYVITEKNMYKDNRNSIAQREIDNLYQKTEFYDINQGLIAIDWNQLYQKHESINRILFFSKDRQSLKEIYDKFLKNKTIGMLLEKKNDDYYSLLVSKKYSKAIGVLKMIHYLNVPISHTVAFGDAANDYEMLSIVARGIAMKNASMDLGVKEMTEYTNQEDGVAKHLQKMLDQGEL